jgi:sugar/nucleoside kinase (ribokinase family)
LGDVPNLLVAGSVALDSLQGGRIRDELGGSAVYFSLAASLLQPVTVVAAVGQDGQAKVRQALGSRGCLDLTRLSVLDQPTYRWFAENNENRNIDLGSRDEIYDVWRPEPPSGYQGWAFCGSMRPDRQLQAVQQLTGCGLLAGDAMLSYVEHCPEESRKVLALVDWYFANEQELRALGGHDPQRFRQAWGLQGLVIKRGRRGATLYSAAGSHHQPAQLNSPVVDTTGAGDCLAGAMLAALRWGVAAATIGISDIGIRAIHQASATDLEQLAELGVR